MTSDQDETAEAILLRLQHENAKLQKINEELRLALGDAAMHLDAAANL